MQLICNIISENFYNKWMRKRQSIRWLRGNKAFNSPLDRFKDDYPAHQMTINQSTLQNLSHLHCNLEVNKHKLVNLSNLDEIDYMDDSKVPVKKEKKITWAFIANFPN